MGNRQCSCLGLGINQKPNQNQEQYKKGIIHLIQVENILDNGLEIVNDNADIQNKMDTFKNINEESEENRSAKLKIVEMQLKAAFQDQSKQNQQAKQKGKQEKISNENNSTKICQSLQKEQLSIKKEIQKEIKQFIDDQKQYTFHYQQLINTQRLDTPIKIDIPDNNSQQQRSEEIQNEFSEIPKQQQAEIKNFSISQEELQQNQSQSQQHHDAIDQQSEKQNSIKNVEIILPNSDSYMGEYKNGNPHGKGVLTKANGERYEGMFVDGLFEGIGKYYFENSDVYEGMFQRNMKQGEGALYSCSNGVIFNGEFKENQKNGQGLEKWPDGSFYKGQYINDIKTGFGELFFSDGSNYKGNFTNDVFNGQGIYQWINQRRYEGNWKDGFMQGKGKMIWLDGRCYEGYFNKDKKSGQGFFSWPDGRIYKGTWLNNKLNGIGEYINKEGIIKTVKWENGKKINQIECQN